MEFSKSNCPFPPASASGPHPESAHIKSTIKALNLQTHIEGGYFIETDRNTTQIPNPFKGTAHSDLATASTQSETRDTSTVIYYLIAPGSPIGYFHRNKGRTVHVHHRGRARYVIIHADEVANSPGKKARIEVFDVGPNIEKGEKLQWIVEGGKFKASFLLPDLGSDQSEEGCLITELVTPGFEYADHDFMTQKALEDLVGEKEFVELAWLLRRGERPTEEQLKTKITDRKS